MYHEHARVVLTESPDTFVVFEEEAIDCTVIKSETIGIAEIRHLTAESYRRPRENYTEKHIYLIGLKITSEAQQAALKILEEPPEQVTITLVLPLGVQLLDTVMSRVTLQKLDQSTAGEVFSDWLTLRLPDRLAEIDQRTKKQDTAWMNSIKSELQRYVVGPPTLPRETLEEIDFILSHLLTRGASNKMLLEQLALSMPLTR